MQGMGMVLLAGVLAALAGYLLGSVNCAILVSRLIFGKDVRTLGSGNAGMTNILRNFGKPGAALTLAGDMAKGFVAVFLGKLLFTLLVPGLLPLYGGYVAGIAAILGHTFPVYFGFKGGKGFAVSGAVVFAMAPAVGFILLALFLLIVLCSRMVSLASVICAILYPVASYLYTRLTGGPAPVYTAVCTAIMGAMVVWMHRSNIKRILNGTEYKFGQKKPEPEAPEGNGHAAGGEENNAGH